MGIFNQFPYSNFHEMNLDQIIKIIKDLQVAWANTQTEWASYKDFIDDYFANLDVSDEVRLTLQEMYDNGQLALLVAPEISQWLADNIGPTTPAIDASLSIVGAGADAKATGDAVAENKANLLAYQDGIVIMDITDGGYIDNTDGSVVNYANWAYSDFISLDNIGEMTIYIDKVGTTSNYNVFYDKNKNFISSLPIPYQKNYTVTIPKNAAYVRFSDQTATMNGNFTVHYRDKAFADLLKYQNAELVLNIFDGGYIDNTDGSYVAYNNWSCTDYIALDNVKVLSAYIETSGSPATSPYNAFYDENKVFISGFTFTNNVESRVDVPEGAKFARFSGQTVTMREKTRIKYLVDAGVQLQVRPYKIRVMQNNIGQFRWGYSDLATWGLTEAQYQTVLRNYTDMIMEYQPDIIMLQEYEKFMDKAQTHNAKQVLFNRLYPYASISDADNTPEVIFMNGKNVGSFATKTFTGTDGNTTETCRFANGTIVIKDSAIKVMSGYLHPGSLATVTADEIIRADQFTNLMTYLDNYDTAIVGIDLNVYGDTELSAILNIAAAHGFTSSNNGFTERKVTYVSHVTTPIATANQYYKKIDNILVKGNAKIMSNIVAYDYVTPNEAGSYTNEPIRASLDKLASDHIPTFTDIVFY